MKSKILSLLLIIAMLIPTVPVLALYNVVPTYYINDDFSNYVYKGTAGDDADNDGVSNWRIENESNANVGGYVSKSTATDDEKTGMSGALKIASGSGKIRGAKVFPDNITVGAGQTLITEFDMYTDNGVDFRIGLVPGHKTDAYEEGYFGVPFETYLQSGNTTTWYHDIQCGYGNILYSSKGKTLTYKPAAVNHIKIEYKFNTDVSIGTEDQITVTIRNADGETSATVNVGYRNGNNAYTDGVTQSIKGLNFTKISSSGEAYLDNVQSYTIEDLSTPEITSIKFSDGVNEYTASDSIPASITDIILNFDADVASMDDAAKIIFGSNKELSYAGELVTSKQYKMTLSNQLISGLEYNLEIDASKVIGVSGYAMPQDRYVTFTPTAVSNDTEIIGGKLYDYKIRDEFTDYEYKEADNELSVNNGVDFWRIESVNGVNCSDYVTTEDFTSGDTTLTKSLKISETTNWSSQTAKGLRGGRYFTSTVGAGETLIMEFDIYTDNTSFTIGLVPGAKSEAVEDTMNATVFGIFDDTYDNRLPTMVYRGYDQRNYASNAYGGALEYRREEINHVKIEYSLSPEGLPDTWDTSVITITNGAGETTATNQLNFRSSHRDAGVYQLSSIKGISFTKGEYGVLYVDNFKAYTVYDYKTPEIVEVNVIDTNGEVVESDVFPPSIKPDTVTPNIERAEIIFNTPMRHAVEFIDVLDENGNRVEYRTEYGGQNLSVILHFDNLLLPGEMYTLIVDSGAIAKSGLSSSDSRTLNFTTEANGSVVSKIHDITDVDGNSVNLEEAEGAVSLKSKITLKKTASEEKEYILIMAAYDDDGKMTGMNMTAITLASGVYGASEHEVTLSVPQIENIKNIKAVLCSFPDNSYISADILSR